MRTTTPLRTGLRSVLLAVALAAATAATAAEPWDRAPVFLDKRAPVAQASGGGAAADLAAQARRHGRIKVIAGLAVDMPADDAAAPMAAAREQATLRQVQDGVLATVFGRTRTPAASGGGGGTDDDGVRRYETIPFLSMVVTAAELARLTADDRVVTVQEDVPVPPTLLDSVPLIQAARVHDLGFLGRRYGLAILDTGVDLDHPMFGKRIKAEACFSSEVAGQSKSLCPDGAAVVDRRRLGPELHERHRWLRPRHPRRLDRGGARRRPARRRAEGVADRRAGVQPLRRSGRLRLLPGALRAELHQRPGGRAGTRLPAPPNPVQHGRGST